MKLQYPLKDDSLKKWRTATEHYSLNESGTQDIKPEEKGGWFPVGANNFWHAGIHLDGERPFHAVADGSIVAYRLTSKPIQKGELTTFKEKTSGKEASKTIIEHPISTNFALTRHELKIPDNKSITFYVLYMHLQPMDEPLEWSKKSQVVFHRNKISVKNSDRLHGRGLYLYEEDGSTVITTMPQHAIVTCLHDGAFSKQLKIKRFSKVRFAFRDKVYNGFARLEGNIDQALNNSKGSQEVKIISDKDKASMNGLNLREQSYSFGDVIDLIPAGAELIFETPGDVADEGANLLSSNPPYKKIKGYLINNRMIAREGYVKVDGAYLDAEKYCDLTLDNVKQADIKIRKGEVIGWSSYDGVADNKKTVHMELFITDEDSFTNLKNYTNDCINQNPSLKAEDLLILNQEKLITETEVTGSYERVYFDCNTGKLISKADGEGKKLDISGMREGVKNDTSGPLLRRVVAKHRPEWVSLSPGANDKFFERLKGRPWEYNEDKYGSYKELFFDKLAFWHQLSGFPGEVYFFHPIKFIEHVRLISRPDEMIFVANSKALEPDQLLILTSAESDELKKEEQFLEKKIKKLKEANDSQDQDEIKNAKKQIAKALTTSHSNWGGVDNLTEIRRLSGKKTTYVRSDKIKNHWRKYKLDSDDKKKSLLTKGRLDPKKLKEKFLKRVNKISYGGGISKDMTELFSENFQQYVKEIEKSLEWSSNEEERDPSTVNFEASSQAQLLRFYANAAVEGIADFKKMKFGIDANADVMIALAEAKFKSRAYWPNKTGFDMCFTADSHKFDFGKIRAFLELNATAFVGASAVGSACVHFDISEKNNKPGFKGVSKRVKDIKADGASLTGKLFAGAELGGEVVGKCEWDNPEMRTGLGSDAWCEFASIGLAIKGAVGAGVEGEAKIAYENGKFIIRAGAGVVLGLGAGGRIVAAVGAKTIVEFLQFVYHQLKNHGYHLIHAFSKDAFERITKLQVWAIETGEDIEDYFDEIVHGIKDWFEDREMSKYQAQLLARSILANPDKLKFTTPEAKGILLYNLCKTFIESFEEDQESAIIKILEYVQSQREYHEVCEHISPNGTKIDFYTGQRYLSNILDGNQLGEWGELRRNWEEKEWEWRRKGIKWEIYWKTVYDDNTKKNSPVEITQLV